MKNTKTLLTILYLAGLASTAQAQTNHEIPILSQANPTNSATSGQETAQKVFDVFQNALNSIRQNNFSESAATIHQIWGIAGNISYNGYPQSLNAAGLVLEWAEFTARGEVLFDPTTKKIIDEKIKVDSERAKLISTEVETLFDHLEKTPDGIDKYRFYLRAMTLMNICGDEKLALKFKSRLLDTCRLTEQKTDAGTAEIREIASIFSSLAESALSLDSLQVPPKYTIILGNEIGKPGEKSENNFSISRDFRLRQVALLDRLPKYDIKRVQAHRELVLFLLLYKKNEEAAEQRRILAELLGSDDEQVLFPVQSICGRLVASSAIPPGQTGQLACGMG